MSIKGRITSTDVARLAGVSQSAVSRTFTPGASVAAETREKVLAAANALGYRPNAIARSLITSRSRMIGVVMAYLDNLFYPDVLELLASRLQNRGYQVLLFTGFKDRDSDPVMGQILQYQVDGLILASTTLSSALSEECAAAGVPIVLFNRTTERDAVSSVTSDNRAGGRRIAEFLLAGGHRRYAFVAGVAASSTNRDRETGFCEGLEAAGVGEMIRVAGHYSRNAAAEAARQLFRRREPPDAVFCANDHMAVAVLDVARHELGMQVPEDVSIVGYDDAGPARWAAYALTTVEQPAELMVDATLDILLGQIEGEDLPQRHEVLPGELIVRQSARLPPSGVTEEDGRHVWRPQG
jgi:DNA-binding LacI/PurR family transcriptional regulator